MSFLTKLFRKIVPLPKLHTSDGYCIFTMHTRLQKIFHGGMCDSMDALVTAYNKKTSLLINDPEYHAKSRALYEFYMDVAKRNYPT